MLVKQVFSRSMGVWIFAVALLVGVVFCFTPHEVNRMEAAVKQGSINFLHYQAQLKDDRELMRTESIDEEWVKGFLGKMTLQVVQGEQLLKSIDQIMKLGDLYALDTLHAVNERDWKSLPSPFGPNSYKVARVHGFGHTLKNALEPLRHFCAYWGQEPSVNQKLDNFKAGVSNLITYVSFPYIDLHNRYTANLPNTTIVFRWEEVRLAQMEMKKYLSSYVPAYLKNRQITGVGSVVNWLLRKNGFQIDASILDVLETLYENNPFYRLAASEAHTIYVEDYPEALVCTRALRGIIRKLNNFANALSTMMRTGSWRTQFETNDSAFIERLLLSALDPTVAGWHPWIVHDLKKALYREPDVSVRLTTLDFGAQGRMRRFLKVFAKLEEMSQFYTTYKLFQAHIEQASATRERVVKDLLYLVVYMDRKLRNLIDMFWSEEVKQVCDERDDVGSELGRISVLVNTRKQLCHLRTQVVRVPRVATEGECRFSSTLSSFPDVSLERIALDERLSRSPGDGSEENFTPVDGTYWKRPISNWLKTVDFELKSVFDSLSILLQMSTENNRDTGSSL